MHYSSVIFRLKTLGKTLKAHILTRTNALFFPLNGKKRLYALLKRLYALLKRLNARFLVKNALQNVKNAHFNA